jgi:hypothetical protein
MSEPHTVSQQPSAISHQPQLSRRQLLACGLAGAASLLLPGWSRLAAAEPARATTGKPFAKAVIQIWLSGGPCHLDTFDPKPSAGRDYCGPYNKPIATNVDGIQVCQTLPLLAKQADKYAILRGLTHGNNGHETAAYLTQTGHKADDGLVHPNLGASVAYHRMVHGGYQNLLPASVALTRPMGRISEAGFLGGRFRPFATGGDPNQATFAVEGIVSERVSPERQAARRELLHQLDDFDHTMHDDPLVAKLDACEEQAYSMILGNAGKVFDLSGEPAALRDRYGRSTFGQSCLLARRLIEKGVPMVTINHGGWDTHKQHFQIMNRKLPELDAGVATLLADLAERGLLSSTIVVVGGEFSRTPKVLWEPPWNGGRGHHGKAMSWLLAGGGFTGGTVVGATDERGENVVSRPIWPWDLLGSIYERLGIDLATPLPLPRGGTTPLSPLAGDQIPAKERGGVLREIMG